MPSFVFTRWRGAALVALLFFSGCRCWRHTERHDAVEVAGFEARTATVEGYATTLAVGHRQTVWSVMERDTATGELVETRRETVTETSYDTTAGKIENKAQNSDSAVFSQKSDIITQQKKETPSEGRKNGFRFFFAGVIAAIVATVLILLTKRQRKWKR